MAAGALIFNEKEEFIIVEPSYKSDWEIPGGGIEKNESPQEALIREIKEELGVDLYSTQLLLIHYQKQEHDDVLFFIFEANIKIEEIYLNNEELNSYNFNKLEDVKDKVKVRLHERIERALQAKKLGQIVYFEDEIS